MKTGFRFNETFLSSRDRDGACFLVLLCLSFINPFLMAAFSSSVRVIPPSKELLDPWLNVETYRSRLTYHV